MKKIVVTGAGGYIGRYVVKTLLDLNYEVLAVDMNLDGVDERALKLDIDIFSNDLNIMEKLGNPEICLHMAWKDGFIHNSNAHMEFLSMHYNFIKNMIDGGIETMAVMGTMHEVGYFEGAICEDTFCNPNSMYGISKDALRRSTFLYAKDKNLNLQWLRAFYIYGDDKKSNSIFGKICLAEEQGKEYFPFTTGKNLYDFITVEQLANQICHVIIQSKVNGIINCCSGKPVSLADKIESFIKDNNFKIKLQYGVFPDREYDSPGVWGDPSKINQIMEKEVIGEFHEDRF